MNKKQRWVLFVSAAVIMLMLLFPPFHFVYTDRAPRNVGYGFLFDPPEGRPTVNAVMLLVQWVAVMSAGGILWLALRDKE